MLRVLSIAVALMLCQFSLAAEYPEAACKLSADQSSVLVVASNPSAQAYQCLVTCRANMTGQRAIKPIECRFNLPAKAGEKTKCEIKGGAPDFYSKLSGLSYTCAPR